MELMYCHVLLDLNYFVTRIKKNILMNFELVNILNKIINILIIKFEKKYE
jgi:hypothetical protein